MKRIFFLLWICALPVLADEVPALHDPALDTIANNVGVLDSDLNGYMTANGPWLTASNLTGISSNYLAGSNTYSGGIDWYKVARGGGTGIGAAVTNMAALLGGQVFSAYSNSMMAPYIEGLQDGSWTNGFYDGRGNGTSSRFLVGSIGTEDFYMDFSLAKTLVDYQGTFTVIRGFIIGIVWILFFCAAVHHLQENCHILLGTNQVVGSSQEALGTNLSLPIGILYAIFLAAGVSALFGFFATGGSFIPSSFSSGINSKAVLNTVSATFPAWDVMTACVPVIEIFGAFLNWVFFRYFYSWPLFLLCRSVVKFFIA